MEKFTWLHLTDLHVGMTPQGHLWPNIQEAFFKDLVVVHDRTGPWDVVFFTGDLVQSGRKEEFNRLEELLISIWNNLRELGSDPLLFTVPGNHDLARPEHKNSAVRVLSKWNDNPEIHEEFWTEPASEYRSVIATAFTNYQAWQSSSFFRRGDVRSGLLSGDFSALVQKDNKKIGIVGLNTAFLQLTAGDFQGKLAWDQRQFHDACGGNGTDWARGNDVSILLSHHGVDWLNDYSRTRVTAEIAPAGRFAVHLFGHAHTALTLDEAEGGGPFRHLWQGKSLFGLEQYGEMSKESRLHGYSAGTIHWDAGKAFLRRWPRRARFHDMNGWEMIPDYDSFSLLEDEGTAPRELAASVARGATTRSRSAPLIKPTTAVVQETLDTQMWVWASREPTLAAYCEAVSKAHGHIRFVEIPYLKDVSDVELENLFVEPRLSAHQISADTQPSAWPPCSHAIEVLAKHPQLIVLGDPGSGKSTLVSCLSWQLCRPKPQVENSWTRNFGGLVPLPMILRELRLKADLTWENLVEAFLEHRIGKLLQKKTLDLLLRQGRAIVLLDGLDEIGNLGIRRKLKDAVHAGMAAYPNSRWIMTSRIVGYEQVPFHYKRETITTTPVRTKKTLPYAERSKRVRTEMSSVFYQAPFNDDQIHRFSVNWYSQHEPEGEVITSNAEDFVQAVRENEGTQRLARIPYLLTLMALVHHKEARLPHGRTELYERIATAYLESIDLRRQLNQLPYSLAQKKRWLADVAYRMQLRRVKNGSNSSEGNLLATKSEVQKWLRTAMLQSGARESKDESEALLRYFAQRSGLLVPRGEGKFAFMHLSLQEYFAASFLEPRLTASRFSPKSQKVEPTNQQLRRWANSDAWRETFVLLFELLSAKSTTETEAFLDYLFNQRLVSDTKGRESTAVSLLAEVVTDPFVVLSRETGRRMRQLCWRWVFGREKTVLSFWEERENPLRSLLRETQGDLRSAWKAASIAQSELRPITHLDLSQCSSVSDLRPLAQLKRLQALDLKGCTGVEDLSSLSALKHLRSLDLEGCSGLTSLESLSKQISLEMLVLSKRFDLSSLRNLSSLHDLHLHYSDSSPTDLTPVSDIRSLASVCAISPVIIAPDLVSNPEKISSSGVRFILAQRDLDGRFTGRRRVPSLRRNKSKKR